MSIIRIDFKLYNAEVVDCSTGYVNIVPDESSLGILLDMVKVIVEAEFVQAIGDFTVRFQGNVGPLITYKSPYISDKYSHKSKYYESYGIKEENIKIQDSPQSREDKIFGLFVESFESAQSRNENEANKYILPSGLSGVEGALRIVYAILEKKSDMYPSYIPAELDTIIYLSLGIDIGFVEGALFMESIVVDSRKNLVSIIFNSDGIPLPEEEYDIPVFSFIGKNVDHIFQNNWPDLYELDYVWGDDELMYAKNELMSIDARDKLNSKAFFLKGWDFPILKELIHHDIQFDNIIAIYNTGFPRQLWVVARSRGDLPKIDTYGVHYLTLDSIEFDKLNRKELLYGTHITKSNYNSLKNKV